MREVKTPDRWVEDCWKKIPGTAKAAFFSTIVLGLMTHLYQFTNKLYNYDELAVTPAGYGIGAEAGRWFLKILGDYTARYFGNYSLPLLNGMLSVFFLAVSAALVADMFQVKSKLSAAAIGGFMVTFTPVVCMFFFMYAAVFYSIGIFFSILAAWFVMRFPKNIWLHIAAVALLTCSLGTYQAYFSNAACIFVMGLILMSAFDKEARWQKILLTALRYLGVLVASLVLYLLLHKVLLAHWNLQMVNYQGLDSMGQITVPELLGAVKRCYRDMVALCTGHVMYLAPSALFRKCFVLVYLILGISVVSLFLLDRRDWVKKAFVIFGFLVFPLALFLVYLMSPNGWAYTLMGYSVVFLLVFLRVWTEHFCWNITAEKLYKAGLQWGTSILSIVMILLYVWYGNGCYMALEYTKYHDMAYYETMVTQIKSMDGYTDDMPVAMIGNEIDDATNNMGSMLGGTFGLDGKIETNISAYSKVYIMTKYLGFAPNFCGYETIAELMELDEVQEMPCYPDAGSIKIVNGIVVIKLTAY